jgi:hypothetical protein
MMIHDDTEQPLMVPVRRAAKRIGISHTTIERYPSDFFAVHRLGGHNYVLRTDLAAWIAAKCGNAHDGRVQRA